jgi:hypothetical protein
MPQAADHPGQDNREIGIIINDDDAAFGRERIIYRFSHEQSSGNTIPSLG